MLNISVINKLFTDLAIQAKRSKLGASQLWLRDMITFHSLSVRGLFVSATVGHFIRMMLLLKFRKVLVPQSRPFLTFCKVTCSKSLNKSASLKPTLTEPSHEYPNWIGVMFMVTLKSRDLSFLGESV